MVYSYRTPADAMCHACMLISPHHQVNTWHAVAIQRCPALKPAIVIHGVGLASHAPQHGILLLHQVCNAGILHAYHMLHSNTLGWACGSRRQALLSPAQAKRAKLYDALTYTSQGRHSQEKKGSKI